ncbi:MAG: hypothetical protein EI684_00815 [Candidatus Viridilinea halotolerans]|uniref:LamG-like jellyroll fold domain-containing protein n=1 Tax=Candidatus Viridilinea halotolerans TaxID=2491704 RepID=A0A426UBX0_9CHLR|nr:MAG: hypothetical protein EI684_00815 [Candidatus Viridilinea halotolerans]
MVGLLVGLLGLVTANQAVATVPNRQPWTHVPGVCPPALQGAVFARAGDDCGGSGTSFDTAQVYGHALLVDAASPSAPCENGRTSGTCYRKWYTGFDANGARRIGLALSPDGVSWARVVGTNAAGSVLGFGPVGNFDSANVSFPSVIRTATGYQMWYTGGDGAAFSIGTATSNDGVTWTRLAGPLAAGAVLRPSGVVGSFDQSIIAAARVLQDGASAAAPCENGRASGTCYRMWYQGINSSNAFYIGYALSPDGLNWTRVAGTGTGGAVIGQGPVGTFDGQNAAVAAVIKDGALFRMWYNAQDSAGVHRIGHVVSTDGLNWVRPVPNSAVWSGSDDPGTLAPDYVWSPFVIKEGLTYRMWYNTAIRENSQRVSLASVTPGTPLGDLVLSRDGANYTLSFTTATPIPAGGYVLVNLPAALPFAALTPGALSGFGANATLVADATALSDGAAGGVSRGALVVRLPDGAAPGAKSISFSLAGEPYVADNLFIQSFDSREVLERGSLPLFIGEPPVATATPTATALPTSTATPTDLPTNTATATNTPTASITATATITPAATNTPTASITATATITPTATNTPTASATALPTNTPLPTSTPTPAPEANAQPWQQVAGPCSNLGGAVFGRANDNCGGNATSFDVTEIFPPQVLRDEASAARPCENGRTSGVCYRMWYVGTGPAPFYERSIGLALSPDGTDWQRASGPLSGGAVFGASGVAGSFDRDGVSTMNIIRVGATYRMWYTGFSDPSTIAGIGLAESLDGINWTRIPGPEVGNAVLRHSGIAGQFDATYIVAPSVILDQASATLPCENGRTSGACYRMWYEGVSTSPAYTFRIGLALSPDGITWTRVATNADGSVTTPGPFGTFDDNNLGVPTVIKDGAIFRMWYEASGYSAGYTTGYMVSTDGINWTRATPNTPVWRGPDDTIVAGAPDEVWAVRALKEDTGYRLYYTTSTRPNSTRFALAAMTPGAPLNDRSVTVTETLYTLNFSSAAVPNGGSVLVTLPASIPFANVSAEASSGFGSGALLSADPAAVTDAAAGGSARGAIVVRLPNGAPAGAKSITLRITGDVPANSNVFVQLFNQREVVAYGALELPAQNGPTNTPTASNTPGPSPTATNTAVPATATNTAVPATATNTAAPTNTPVPGSNFALSFDGNDQLTGSAVPGLNGSQTIELWVRPAAVGQDGVIVATGASNGWSLELNGGQVTWWMLNSANSWQMVQYPTALSSTTWSHVALSYNASTNSARIFVNGVAGPQGTVGGITVGPSLFVGGLNPYGFFNGQLDELRLSSGVRYSSNFTPPSAAFTPDATTLALFSLNEGSGTTAADRSGNGLSLTLGAAPNAATWITSSAPSDGATPSATSTPVASATPAATSTVGPSPTATSTPVPPTATNTAAPTNTPVPGSNFALSFDGNDQLTGSAVPGLNGSQTIELWVRPAAVGQNAVLVATGADSGWSLELNDGQITWWMLNSANSWQMVQYPTALSSNNWSHVALSYNASSNSARIFVNGVAGPQVTVGGITAGTGLFVGGLNPYGFFNGQLDELRLSSGVRYTNNFIPPSAAFTPDATTLALFSFNEGSGTTAADRSGNGLSLTLGATPNTPTWVNGSAPTQ